MGDSRSWRTQSVFVSSTFRDMHGERYWLHRHVFPELEERLVALEPENTDCLRDLFVSYNNMGILDVPVDPANARQWYEQALEIARSLVALEPENSYLIRDALNPCLRLAGLAGQAGHLEADRQYSHEALALVQQGIQADSDDAGLYYSLACAHARLGQTTDALAALARHVGLGGSDADWTAQDPDFASIRDLPEFHGLLEHMRRKADDH